MKIWLIIISGFWVFQIPLLTKAQVEQPVRYEVELSNFDNYFNVISAEDKGLVIVREIRGSYKKGNVNWEMIYLDTLLNEVWSNEYPIEYNFKLRGYDFEGQKVYLLFERGPNRLDKLILFSVDILRETTRIHEIKKSFPIELTHFEVLDGTVILGGNSNSRPAVFQYYPDTEQTKVLPGFYMDRSELLQLEVDNKARVLKVLVSYRTFEREYSVSLKSFSHEGEMLTNIELDPEEKKDLISGRAITVNEEFEIITGTYSYRKSDYSRGIFIAKIEPDGSQSIQYYNYADLENFFNYMKARRKRRIKDKIERKKVKGRKIKFNYRLLVHDILPHDDGYIMLGEAYYPKYNNIPYYSYYDNSPSSYRSGNTYFEGYKYTHAIVIGFDKKGKVTWDNSFEINDVLTYNLEQYVEVSSTEDRTVLLYNFENVIRSKLIDGQKVLEGKAFNDISLKFADDIVKSNVKEFGDLKQWYSDCFYAFGVQKIKNLKDIGIKLNREVFFINKIVYN